MAPHRFASSLAHTVFRGRLVLWCGITIALLSLNGFVFYHNMGTLVDHDSAVTHAQDVLSSLENVQTSLDEAETGERGYIITGDRSYLQPYTAATQAIDGQVGRVAALTAGDSVQQRRLPQLKTLIAAKLDEEALIITLSHDVSFDAAKQAVLSDRSKNLMDDLRGLISDMKRTEIDLVDRYSAQAHGAIEATTITLVLASVADIALLCGLFVLIQQGITRSALVMAERERLLRAEQVARAEAEDSVRVRDTFLSLASHELRTPLTTLLGNTQLLQMRFAQPKEIDDRDRQRLAAVARQGNRLRLLIDQLLDVSRLQHGQLSINRVPLNLSDLVRRVVEEAQATTSRHTIELRGAEEPVPIDGDALRLEQALHNLLSNAIKYSPRGGRISVQMSRADGHVQVSVTDSGIGIPASAQDQLFQRFYRASNVDAEGVSSGLGIGLYVVKEIIERHDGTIDVVSTEGVGSTFTLRLPIAVPQPAARPTADVLKVSR